ncbi:MAG TPA: 2OG-Fe dioxygenase family protein [Steroidobacteraceae bacterium]
MNNGPNCPVSVGHEKAWASLAEQGYALTNDRSIGLPDNFRQNFRDRYFNSGILCHDEGDMPEDRQRARDVIRYRWDGGDLRLRRHESITITDRAGIPGKREHTRVELLKDTQAVNLLHAFLRLVPPDRRQPDGTFGVNLFRTFTNVVTKPHHDNEKFIIIYVIDRIGDGANTRLYLPEDVTEDGRVSGAAVIEQQLNPGDIILFEDELFKHDASPLISLPDRAAMRDALICTVDNIATYLAP